VTLKDHPKNLTSIAEAINSILLSLNEDITRPGLIDTPKRAASSLLDLTSGLHITPGDVVKGAIFPCESEGMVLQSGIEFYSLCEHHLLPFFGRIHIAYFPDKRIIGLSKLGRIVDIFAKRLQVQENLTKQILSSIHDLLVPKGVAVVIEAEHLCMMMRGIKKQGSITKTQEFSGVFRDNNSLRSDFLQLIK
jgi:GTP cyclohydrolase IA